eukprot:CAMPEP_0204050864 /NCGR_PEP_ID=MMETSP0360-20130528/121249_1 /ASSEMBLY_ACC=CAM_ASM_000342 /TAXON_ID=268821 /ORGANISM="Scrippsiella Hangoei, Strain SHTV-5" /LENGTH=40 /DNA_ID= /DNA_START= /DNA_END= /DNA_ORIENTATION=
MKASLNMCAPSGACLSLTLWAPVLSLMYVASVCGPKAANL